MEANQESRAVEAVKLLSDYAKWLVTVGTTAVAAVSYVLTIGDPFAHGFSRILACGAVAAFAASILCVTALLRTLPTVMQEIKPGQSIWKTHDRSGMGFHFDTSALASLGSVFFVTGVLLISVTVILKLLHS